MGPRERDTTARVNSHLCIQFGAEDLTSYAGLELVSRFMRRIRFADQLPSSGGQVADDILQSRASLTDTARTDHDYLPVPLARTTHAGSLGRLFDAALSGVQIIG